MRSALLVAFSVILIGCDGTNTRVLPPSMGPAGSEPILGSSGGSPEDIAQLLCAKVIECGLLSDMNACLDQVKKLVSQSESEIEDQVAAYNIDVWAVVSCMAELSCSVLTDGDALQKAITEQCMSGMMPRTPDPYKPPTGRPDAGTTTTPDSGTATADSNSSNVLDDEFCQAINTACAELTVQVCKNQITTAEVSVTSNDVSCAKSAHDCETASTCLLALR